MSDVKLNLDAVNPYDIVEKNPVIDAKEQEVVFVPFEDTELTINNKTWLFPKGVDKKITRDQARVLIEAKKGYIKE